MPQFIDRRLNPKDKSLGNRQRFLRRAKARGVSEAEYMSGNLLRAEVTAADVAQAFVALAKARKTTGHIETVDGGNIAAALR